MPGPEPSEFIDKTGNSPAQAPSTLRGRILPTAAVTALSERYRATSRAALLQILASPIQVTRQGLEVLAKQLEASNQTGDTESEQDFSPAAFTARVVLARDSAIQEFLRTGWKMISNPDPNFFGLSKDNHRIAFNNHHVSRDFGGARCSSAETLEIWESAFLLALADYDKGRATLVDYLNTRAPRLGVLLSCYSDFGQIDASTLDTYVTSSWQELESLFDTSAPSIGRILRGLRD